MSHTKVIDGFRFHFNSDYSGAVDIVDETVERAQPAFTTRLRIPLSTLRALLREDIKQRVLEEVRGERGEDADLPRRAKVIEDCIDLALDK